MIWVNTMELRVRVYRMGDVSRRADAPKKGLKMRQ